MTETTPPSKLGPEAAARLHLTGLVQGIGLRPAVARLAHDRALNGYVGNTHAGVEIHIEGSNADVERFEAELLARLPVEAVITSFTRRRVEPEGYDRFLIGRIPQPLEPITNGNNRAVEPRSETIPGARLSAQVPRDVVVCGGCVSDISDATGRRHGYPFTSCTSCGPRYSIIDQMPYERSWTSMVSFPLCDACRREYESPVDRRFHAQTNACPACGPRIWLGDTEGRVLASGSDTLLAAATALRDGRIVALRGLGGYQLLVDASSREAVDRLRERKGRRGKPLAVMVASIDEARSIAHLEEIEGQRLADPSGPIVVVSMRGDAGLAFSIHGGLSTVGLMLPTTPLHFLLLDAARRPLVCTSGNVEGDPIAHRPETGVARLRGVADLWLEHDRPIRRPIDDSVIRVMAGRPVTIRLARGLAPLPLPITTDGPLVALGGHQKAALALSNGPQAVLGPHVGDLDGVATRCRMDEHLNDVRRLYGVDQCLFACDAHPEYHTTALAERECAEPVRVHHHHAHIVAAMLEHSWLDREVLGVSMDGTGYGADGTIWGGEFLRATVAGFERVGQLRPFMLAGGERAIREPWRVATALVRDAAGEEPAARLSFGREADSLADTRKLLCVLARPPLCSTTTSAGRLFDGVAALVLNVATCEFEGQAAMLLESACDPLASGRYDIPAQGRSPISLDWRPLVRQLLRDRAIGTSPAVMAMRFHRGLADSIFTFCQSFSPQPVVLGGGVFQNRVLVELLARRFAATSQPLGLPGMIPPNDGGLAAGQLVVAAADRQRRIQSCV